MWIKRHSRLDIKLVQKISTTQKLLTTHTYTRPGYSRAVQREGPQPLLSFHRPLSSHRLFVDFQHMAHQQDLYSDLHPTQPHSHTAVMYTNSTTTKYGGWMHQQSWSTPTTHWSWTLPSHPLDSIYVDACGQRWTTFGLARVDVQPTSSAGIRLQIHPVPVARLYRLCYILWMIVQIWNSPGVCQPCIWLRRRLSPGSACRAHAKKSTSDHVTTWMGNSLHTGKQGSQHLSSAVLLQRMLHTKSKMWQRQCRCYNSDADGTRLCSAEWAMGHWY